MIPRPDIQGIGDGSGRLRQGVRCGWIRAPTSASTSARPTTSIRSASSSTTGSPGRRAAGAEARASSLAPRRPWSGSSSLAASRTHSGVAVKLALPARRPASRLQCLSARTAQRARGSTRRLIVDSGLGITYRYVDRLAPAKATEILGSGGRAQRQPDLARLRLGCARGRIALPVIAPGTALACPAR